jgi:leader peptidase (prepilin peptidase) / N-methyltransferase
MIHLILLVSTGSLPPFPFMAGFIAIMGALVGSFLNVVIHRIPRGESIVFPNSRCPACSNAIRPYDNIPIVSYTLLRGRCRTCQAPISIRYPAVELLTALLYFSVVFARGISVATIFDLVFLTAIVALIFIDAEHMLLPNVITYPGIVLALVARLVLPILLGPTAFDDLPGLSAGLFAGFPLWASSVLAGVLGAIVGGGSLWLVGWIWEKVRGVEAMGLGDVKMMFMVGAYLGWRLTILTIFIGVFAGSLVGIGLVLYRRERNLQMLLPFGIFLGIGTVVALLMGSQIVNWYLGQFQL